MHSLSTYRLGLVPYLNVLPLIEGLETAIPQSQWIRATPRELGRLLSAGEIDLATLPIFEALRSNGYRLLPGCAIGSDGPVRSVQLFSSCPLNRIRRVLLDSASLTSVHLARIVAKDYLGLDPEYTTLTDTFENQLPRMGQVFDAIVAIGDLALQWEQERRFPYSLDLGWAWKELTGLPFVFAAWIARPGVEVSPELIDTLIHARQTGESNIEDIAERHATSPSEANDLADYLKYAVRFGLNADQIRAIELFRIKLIAHGLLPVTTPPLRIIPHPADSLSSCV